MEDNKSNAETGGDSVSKELLFKFGEESIPTVLNEDSYIHSPFYNAIDKGLKLAERFIANFNAGVANQNRKVAENGNHLCANNVISFLGERGSGKTSCILSVIEILRQRYNQTDKGVNLEFFDTIDPSFFDDKHNIIQIFLGEFYRNFQRLSEDYCKLTNDSRDKLKKLQSEFKNVRNSIRFLEKYNDKNDFNDEIGDLSYLSSGVELERSLGRLVDMYLEYKKNKLLVIAIDDIDLNVASSYEMMEQIQKYLILPNVIILLGAKLSQLKDGIVCNRYEYKKKTNLSDSDLARMADNYLVKFLPTNQRVFMPEAKDFMKLKLTIEGGGKKEISGNTVDETILALIFRKTRFLFYNYADESSLIIPRNLRSLRMFATMLYGLDNPDTTDVHQSNKETFKKYLTEQWIPTFIPEYRDFAIGLMNESNVALINIRVIDFIMENSNNLQEWRDYKGSDSMTDTQTERNRTVLQEITNKGNSNVNISLGDVSFVMQLSDILEEDNRLSELKFFIKTFYSIRLYESYDEITSKDVLGGSGFIEKEDTATTIPVLKKDVGVDIPDYFKLVGGSFFTLTGDSFIPLNPYGESREIKLIDASVLIKEISDIINAFTDKKKTPSDSLLHRLRLVEFFILCSARIIELKRGRGLYDWRDRDDYRSYIEPRFLTGFSNSTKNVIFSPVAPFFNMIYPKWSYDRYHKDLFEIALGCKDSLLNKLFTTTRHDNQYHDLMSHICIRNMEVKDDLERWLESKNKGLRPNENGDFGILMDFFSKFRGEKGSYSIKTYDKEIGKESYHTINFKPIGFLYDDVFSPIDKIKDDKEKDVLISLFNNIYSPSDKLVFNRSYPLSLVRDIVESSGIPGSDLLLGHIDNISKIHKDENINSVGLVKYLSTFPLLNSTLAKAVFDKDLIAAYTAELQNRLEQNVVIAEGNLNEIANRLAAIRKDGKDLVREHDKLLKRINAVQDELSKIADEKMKLLMQIKGDNTKHSELKDKIKSVKDSPENPDTKQQLDDIEQKRIDIEISLIQAARRMENLDNTFIPEKEKELSRLRKEMENINGQMEELSEQESSLQIKQRNLSFQLDEAKARLAQAVKDLKSYK